jgi:hypothetical protein
MLITMFAVAGGARAARGRLPPDGNNTTWQGAPRARSGNKGNGASPTAAWAARNNRAGGGGRYRVRRWHLASSP